MLHFVCNHHLFNSEDSFPVVLMGSFSVISSNAIEAQISVKSFLGANDLDLSSRKTSTQILNLLFNEPYKIFKDFEKFREDSEMIAIPQKAKLDMIQYLMKFQVHEQLFPFYQRLVAECLFGLGHQDLRLTGLNFTRYLIQYDKVEQNTIQMRFLKQVLLKVLSSNEPSLNENIKGLGFTLLADLGAKNFSAVEDKVDLLYEYFERLVQIADEMTDRRENIREYGEALYIMEALNKFRDIFAKNLPQDNLKRAELVNFTINMLNKKVHHNEVLYLLFLQLSKLAVSSQQSSTVLFHAILNKSNPDIKIRGEAER